MHCMTSEHDPCREGDRSQDELVVHRLEAIDEAIVSGKSMPLRTDEDSEVIQRRVIRGAECLELLNQLWPRRGNSRRSSTQASEPSTQYLAGSATGGSGLPDRLGRFQIVREIGRGGHGVVFLAFDPNLDREVALKVPSIDVMVSDDLRDRFFRESRAAAALDHPNIVSVFEAGEIGPICYIASAYCPGPNLSAWMRSRSDPIGFDTAARLVAQLAQAVQHAHSRGVLHRDLKPGNVLMSEQRSGPPDSDSAVPLDDSYSESSGETTSVVPRVTDFGLAKLIDADVEATRTGAVFGTPSYMAPEQASGATSQIGPASDIYALGAVLYELLVGRPPFQGETSLEVLLQVQNDEPVAPSRLRPRTPKDLETICRKCLEKDPHRRYESAEQLAEDLHRFLDGTPIEARRIGRLERGWRWCRRRPLPAGLLLALSLALLVGFGGIYWQWRRAEDRAAEAEAERTIANRQRLRAENTLSLSVDSIDHFLTDISASELMELPGTFQIRREFLEAARDYYEQFLKVNRGNPRLQLELARSQTRLGDIANRLGRQDEGRALLQKSLADLLKCEAHDPHDPRTQSAIGQCETLLGEMYRDKGDLGDSLTLLNSSIARFERLCESDPHDLAFRYSLADAIHEAAVAHVELDHDDQAMQMCDRARGLLESLIEDDATRVSYRVTLLGIQNTVGCYLLRRSEVEEAIQVFNTALDTVSHLPRTRYVDGHTAMIYCNLGEAYSRVGEHDKKVEAFREARDLLEMLVKANPGVSEYRKLLAASHQNIAIHARSTGDPETAISEYRAAEHLFTSLHRDAPGHTAYRHGLAKTKLGRGYALQQVNEPEKALQSFKEARDIWDQLSEDVPGNSEYRFMSANCCSVIGTLQSRSGQLREAISSYREAIKRHQAMRAQRRDDLQLESALGAVFNDLGLTLLKSEQYEEALDACQQAIEHQRQAYEQAPQIVTYRQHLSRHYSVCMQIYQAIDNLPRAFEMAQQRRRIWRGDALQLYAASRALLQLGLAIDESDTENASVRAECFSAAFDTLEESIDSGFSDWSFFEKDAVFDPVRSDSKFRALRDKLNSRLKSRA